MRMWLTNIKTALPTDLKVVSEKSEAVRTISRAKVCWRMWASTFVRLCRLVSLLLGHFQVSFPCTRKRDKHVPFGTMVHTQPCSSSRPIPTGPPPVLRPGPVGELRTAGSDLGAGSGLLALRPGTGRLLQRPQRPGPAARALHSPGGQPAPSPEAADERMTLRRVSGWPGPAASALSAAAAARAARDSRRDCSLSSGRGFRASDESNLNLE
jgi:hypothetical protein